MHTLTICTPSAIAVIDAARRHVLAGNAAVVNLYHELDRAGHKIGAPARAVIAAGNCVDDVAGDVSPDTVPATLVFAMLDCAREIAVADRLEIDRWLASVRGCRR